MKIAILFSGRISCFQKSYPNIMENIVQGNDVDFFISYSKDSDINETNAFLEKFEPKVFMESDEKYFFVKDIYRKTRSSWHNVMCMYLNRQNVQSLFKKYIEEHQIQYDLVLSYRVDYWIHSKLNLQQLILKSNEGLLCIPVGNDYQGLNDQMAIGNMNTIIKYLSVYDSLPHILQRFKTLNPEIILQKYVKLKNIKLFRFPLETTILRK
jgi:hypothetical protein